MATSNSIKHLGASIVVALVASSLTACGGGGGGGGSSGQSDNDSIPNIDTNPNPSNDPTDPNVTCQDTNANNPNNSDKPDLDQDGINDNCDSDIDGDGVLNEQDAKPSDATIAGMSTRSYQGNDAGNVDATHNAYFNAKKQLIKEEYLSSTNPERANFLKNYTYDDKGRLIRLEEAYGTDTNIDRVEAWVYNANNQLVEHKVSSDGDDIFEATTAYQYNSNGDITQIVESDTSSTSLLDNLTRIYVYNAQHQLEQVKTDESNDGSIDRITELTYDPKNNLTRSSLYYIETNNSAGNEAERLYRTLEYSYDGQGNVLKTSISFADGDAQSTTYVYDEQKNIIRKIINDNSGDISVIDTEVTYDQDNLTTIAKTKYDSSNNVQDVTNTAKYNQAGFLTKVLQDVSQDGDIDQVITYSYQGSVPAKFNIAPFLNLGEFTTITPTATSIFSNIGVSYTSDTVKNYCYADLNIYAC